MSRIPASWPIWHVSGTRPADRWLVDRAAADRFGINVGDVQDAVEISSWESRS